MGSTDSFEPSIGEDRIGTHYDLVDPGHHGKDGGIRDDRRLDPAFSQTLSHFLTVVKRSALGDDHLLLLLFVVVVDIFVTSGAKKYELTPNSKM